MAYDEGLATRIRDAIGDRPGLAEKQMFGGLASVWTCQRSASNYTRSA